MMARLAAHLPHSGVGLAPTAGGRVGQIGRKALDLRVQLAELVAIPVQRVEQLAVDIQLRLTPRVVADSDRR